MVIIERSLDPEMRLWLIKLLAPALSIVALVQVAWTVLSRANHDWDLDAFLYLGSRLAEGELLYTHDFETKLPLVQYLFYWPHLLGGIGAWKLLNFSLVLGLGYLASSRLTHALLATPDRGDGARRVTWYLTSLYLVMLYSLPGAWSGHLEMVSASLVYLACAWLLLDGRRPIDTHGMRDAGAGFLVGLASLLRPNYVYVAAALLVWISCGPAGRASIRPIVYRSAKFLTGFGLALGAAFLPYAISGPASLAALVDGLGAIGAFSSGMDPEALLRAQFASLETGWLYAVLYLGLVIAVVQRLRRPVNGPGRDGFESGSQLLALLSTLGLVASLLRNHYWVHNVMLFTPIALIVIVSCLRSQFEAMANPGRNHGSPQLAGQGGFAALTALTLVVLGAAFYSTGRTMLDSLPAGVSLDINDRNIDHRLMQRLQPLHEASISFLAAGYPIYHARLGEPRIGDGHPYMLLRALSGKGLPNLRGLYLYGDEVRASPCLALSHTGKEVIVVATNDVFYPWVEQCLGDGLGGYARLAVHGMAPYVFYTRSDARDRIERVLRLR